MHFRLCIIVKATSRIVIPVVLVVIVLAILNETHILLCMVYLHLGDV